MRASWHSSSSFSNRDVKSELSISFLKHLDLSLNMQELFSNRLIFSWINSWSFPFKISSIHQEVIQLFCVFKEFLQLQPQLWILDEEQNVSYKVRHTLRWYLRILGCSLESFGLIPQWLQLMQNLTSFKFIVLPFIWRLHSSRILTEEVILWALLVLSLNICTYLSHELCYSHWNFKKVTVVDHTQILELDESREGIWT